jgi:hypothetical protein
MSKSLVTGIYDSFVMDGKLFLSVCKTSIESSPRSNQFTSHFYLAPYVGIIRREELTDSLGWQVWKLKRYRIEP